jgi:hypothetical protein
LFGEEFVQKVRLLAGVNACAELKKIGFQVSKGVDAALFPLTYEG